MSSTTLRQVELSKEVEVLREILKEHGAKLSLTAAGTGIVVLGLYGSAIVANATILAVVTTAGIVLVASKLPKRIQRAMVKHGFMTDCAAAVGTYWMLGKSVTSLLAAGMVGCLVSIMIWVVKPLIEEEEMREKVVVTLSTA